MDIYGQTHTHMHVVGCTCSRSKLPALITILNCTILYSCLKSYKWGKYSAEIEFFIPMCSSSLPILIFCYSLIFSVFHVEQYQTRMGNTVLSLLSHLAAKESLDLTAKITVRALSQSRPEHSLQLRKFCVDLDELFC